MSRFPKLKHAIHFIVDFIRISETSFDLLEGDRNFHLNEYHLITADYPRNTKQGGVCIYHKESLGACLVKLLNLSPCIIVKFSCKIVKDMLVLSTELQVKTILNLKIFCLTLMSF